ncbi:hypothetical protein GQ55_1G374900 [Panicum hallii var. hallii]|uniref:Uncharacterized protein n=1 Tax=Panicum hallii var. hallii TaxID=1504633 RepID=A0A2T7FBM9_9POAL|nr:hypothetical protein GQ55_1G374900 [Panicum hallii var. hallii]
MFLSLFSWSVHHSKCCASTQRLLHLCLLHQVVVTRFLGGLKVCHRTILVS